MISAIYLLSSTAEVLVYKNYRTEQCVYKHQDYFDELAKFGCEAQPIKIQNGIKYIQILKDNIYFVAVTTTLSQEFDLQINEFLDSLYTIIRQFCGLISAESIKNNAILIYEILLEVIDNGIIQVTNPKKLQLLIQSEPVLPSQESAFSMSNILKVTESLLSSESSVKSTSSSFSSKDSISELFVDVIEHVCLLLDKEGKIILSDISGDLCVRNHIPGQSSIKIGLNENLIVGTDEKAYNLGVQLDECRFPDSVDSSQFGSDKIIGLSMRRGEMSICKYHLSKGLQSIPLRIAHEIKKIEGSRDLELLLKFTCEIPGNAELLNVKFHIPVTRSTTTTMHQFSLPDSSVEFMKNVRKVLWKIKKIPGLCEAAAKIRLVDAYKNESSLMELGRISVEFEASNFVPSGLKIRFLNVSSNHHSADSNFSPKKWIRYVTLSDSYEVKLR